MSKENICFNSDPQPGIGLPYEDIFFIRNKPENDRSESQNEIKLFLEDAFSFKNPDSIVNNLPEDKFGLENLSKIQIDFINWGNTQLVYLASLLYSNNKKEKLAVLVNQPTTPFGSGLREFENLKKLSDLDSNFVVRPFCYFSNKEQKQELYVSPYIEKAKCIIGVKEKWGVFDPDPLYHYEQFSDETSDQILANMIGLLVYYYDPKSGLAIVKTQISGDDFILEKKWEENPTISNIKLIAARELKEIKFNDYINKIKCEFLKGTNLKKKCVKEGGFEINYGSEKPIPQDITQKGIDLGMHLKKGNPKLSI